MDCGAKEKKPMVYLSGALSDMTEEERSALRKLYESFGEVCREFGFDSYMPHVYSDPVRAASLNPQDVDGIDRTAVAGSCLVIAYVGVAAIGTGIEIEMAYHSAKPVVLVYEKKKLDERRITRLARGNPAVVHHVAFENHEGAIAGLREFLRKFVKEAQSSTLPEILKL